MVTDLCDRTVITKPDRKRSFTSISKKVCVCVCVHMQKNVPPEIKEQSCKVAIWIIRPVFYRSITIFAMTHFFNLLPLNSALVSNNEAVIIVQTLSLNSRTPTTVLH